jgi:hypothetical protein
MKRYILFAGEQYYAMGGMADVKHHSDDLNYILSRTKIYEWYQVFDTKEGRVTHRSELQAHGSHNTCSPYIQITNDL